MKKLFVAIALLWASVAQANIIEISTDQVDVTAGDVVSYEIRLVDFEEFDFLSFDLEFDVSVFSFDAFSLVSDYEDAFLSADGSGLTVFDFTFGPGAFGLSFGLLAPFALDPVSGATFSGSSLLASFDLIANASGSSDFFVSFIDGAFNFVPLQQDIEVRVASTTVVSEPATLGMFAALLIAGGMVRRRRS